MKFRPQTNKMFHFACFVQVIFFINSNKHNWKHVYHVNISMMCVEKEIDEALY